MKDFHVLDFQTGFNILEKASKITEKESDTPVMYVFAGPNASGKSTLIANLYMQSKLNVPYINADVFTKLKFANIEDEEKRNMKGMFYAMNLVKEFIGKKQSFSYETVLSHESKIELIKQAKENGYKVVSTFVCTSSPEININRLQLRVVNGGHDVPKEKVVSRFYKSVEHSKLLKQVSDEYEYFDNSQDLVDSSIPQNSKK